MIHVDAAGIVGAVAELVRAGADALRMVAALLAVVSLGVRLVRGRAGRG